MSGNMLADRFVLLYIIAGFLSLKLNDKFQEVWNTIYMAGLILDLRTANESRRHIITPSLVGRVQT